MRGEPYQVSANGLSITCGLCGFRSYHPMDVKERYCSRCHLFLNDLSQQPAPGFQVRDERWPARMLHAANREGREHYCPVEGCGDIVPYSQLMCLTHWLQVPAEMRSLVWRAYAYGARSRPHVAACKAAIAAVEQRKETA